MFPNVEIDTGEQLNEIKKGSVKEKFGRTFLFDFEAGDFVLNDGKLVLCNEVDSVSVWIEKYMRTEKFKFKAYDDGSKNQYGLPIMELMGQRMPTSFISAEIKRELTEALKKHPMIQDIENFKFEKIKDILYVDFDVRLIDGKSFNKEVKLDGNS